MIFDVVAITPCEGYKRRVGTRDVDQHTKNATRVGNIQRKAIVSTYDDNTIGYGIVHKLAAMTADNPENPDPDTNLQSDIRF